MEAHVAEETQILNPGSDIRTDLELVCHRGVGEGGGKHVGVADEVKGLSTDRDQGGGLQVTD